MNAELSNLYAPDLMLAEQYFDAQRPALDGERALMLAVLQDAVECFQKFALARDPRGRAEFEQAQAWIESHDRDWPYSFENICDVLEINAVYLREGLKRFAPQRVVRGELRKPRIVPLEERRHEQEDGDSPTIEAAAAV